MDTLNIDLPDNLYRKQPYRTRLGLATFATLVRYLESIGGAPDNRSDAIRKSVEILIEFLVEVDSVKPFHSVEDAYLFLKERGLEPDISEEGRNATQTALEQERANLGELKEKNVSRSAVAHAEKVMAQIQKEKEQGERPTTPSEEHDEVEDEMMRRARENPNYIDDSEDNESEDG